MKKNLGGDRLGSGAKMDVEIHSYQKSTHNISKVTRTTMAVGTLVPIFSEFMQQGDDWEIDLDTLIMTHPTEGPLFGSFKVQIDVFTAPLRLYQGKMHMNLLQQGTSMQDIKLPQISVSAAPLDWNKDVNTQQINPSSVLAYLGIRGIGNSATETYRLFNAHPLLMYYDIYGEYYANQQEKVGYILHSGLNQNITSTKIYSNDPVITIPAAPTLGTTGILNITKVPRVEVTFTGNLDASQIKVTTPSGQMSVQDMFTDTVLLSTGVLSFSGLKSQYDGYLLQNYLQVASDTTLPQMYQFPLTNINNVKLDILANIKSTSPFIINQGTNAPYGIILDKTGSKFHITNSQEGLALKTYQSDLFNNWLDTASINAINSRASISTAGNTFTMESFLMAEKLYKYLNRIQLAGNTLDDWKEINWGKSGSSRIEKPQYEGGLSKELVFEEVISTTGTNEQPLGSLAGRGRLNGKHKGGKVRIKADEHGYVMIIASLTPRLDYYQGNKWHMNLETMEDIHKSAFDNIGFQNLITDQMAFWDTQISASNKTFRTAGKQPSWINYQTNINEVYGNFAIKSSEGWMVLTRDYEQNVATKTIKDLTTYIDPAKWNDIFAYKSRDAQNFWGQFAIDAKVRRVMSANQIPNM